MRKSSMFYGVLLSMIMSVAAASEGVAQQKEIQTVAEAMAQKISKAGKTSIAVVDFTDLDGNVTQLGRYIAEEMSVALLNAADNFEVVDRTHLKTLLQQHKLSATGLIDPATATKLGKLAGVEALITGTLTPFGDSFRLAVKVLDVNTAKLIGAMSADLPNTETLKTLDNNPISGDQPTPEPKPTATKKPTNSAGTPTRVTEMLGFTIELNGCKKAGDNVTCNYTITSNGKDRRFSLCGDDCSNFFDEFGNEYEAIHATLADKSSSYWAETLLITDVRTKASVTFGKVSPDATIMKLYNFRADGENGEDIKIQFRDVPMLK